MMGGYPILSPKLDVTAIGAGGGSIAWRDVGGAFNVGPRSAGADPGPLCYGKGGSDVTVTDANVALGRLPGDALLDGRMPIDARAAQDGVARLAAALALPPADTALGILQVATANMVRAIRTISVERGHRPGDFALFAFGGAGPLHACDVARELEMSSVIVPPQPGLLCADGLLASDLASDFVVSVVERLAPESVDGLARARETLLTRSHQWFETHDIAAEDRLLRWTAELRYVGQNFELSVPLTDAPFDRAGIDALDRAFQRLHEQNYGYAFDAEPIEIVNLKLTAIGRLARPPAVELAVRKPGAPVRRRDVTFAAGGPIPTPVYRRDDLAVHQVVAGPAIIEQVDTTTIVFPGDVGITDACGNFVITVR
jgi:N-methylhydantoinase A